MNPSSLRQDLAEIVRQLQEPLAAIDHSIRPLPGGSSFYVYLNWEVVRERLLSVVPDYELDYTLPQIDLTTNRCICKATITILGISKTELGDVPVSEKSDKGKEMTRGTACDRSKAEAFRNAAEAWGVGTYLKDQYFVYKLLEADKANISEDYRNKLNALASQLKSQLQKGELQSRSHVLAKNGVKPLFQKEPAVPPKPTPKAQAQQTNSGSNVALLPTKTTYLYPSHNHFTTGFLEEFGFPEVRRFVIDAIAEEFPGKRCPGDLPQEDFEAILSLVVARWATHNGYYADTGHALNAFVGKIHVIKASLGGFNLEQFKEEAIAWRNALLVS